MFNSMPNVPQDQAACAALIRVVARAMRYPEGRPRR